MGVKKALIANGQKNQYLLQLHMIFAVIEQLKIGIWVSIEFPVTVEKGKEATYGIDGKNTLIVWEDMDYH